MKNSFDIFINQQVINNKNEMGTIASFDDKYIVVKYQNCTKTYNTKMVFKSGFIRFLDDRYNALVNDYLTDRLEEDKKLEKEKEHSNKISHQKVVMANKFYAKLAMKNHIMVNLFGSDFKYPPYMKFMLHHKHLLREKHSSYRIYQEIRMKYFEW